MEGATFIIGPELAEAERRVVQAVEKALGPHKAHQKEISDILYERASAIIVEQRSIDNSDAVACLSRFEALASTITRYLHPSYNWILAGGVSEVAIGPVKLKRGQDVVTELQPNSKFVTYELSSTCGLQPDSAGIKFGIAPTVWDISLVASGEALREEAEWLADVFGSYVRSVVPWDMLGYIVPKIGDEEADPFRPDDETDASIAVKHDGTGTLGGRSLQHKHIISPQAAAFLLNEDVQNKSNAIFAATRKSLGARIYLGLGWLSRARRSKDRAGRGDVSIYRTGGAAIQK